MISILESTATTSLAFVQIPILLGEAQGRLQWPGTSRGFYPHPHPQPKSEGMTGGPSYKHLAEGTWVDQATWEHAVTFRGWR